MYWQSCQYTYNTSRSRSNYKFLNKSTPTPDLERDDERADEITITYIDNVLRPTPGHYHSITIPTICLVVRRREATNTLSARSAGKSDSVDLVKECIVYTSFSFEGISLSTPLQSVESARRQSTGNHYILRLGPSSEGFSESVSVSSGKHNIYSDNESKMV